MLMAAAVVLAVLFGTTAGGVQAAPGGAAGANGTVKIHDDEPEPDPEIRNQPQVCTFHVHGFNFDQGETGRWWIQEWPPTLEGDARRRDETAAVMGPENWTAAEDDGQHAWEWRTTERTLDDGHYKLFVERSHATGNGDMVTTYKQKVFWVDCPEEQAGGEGAAGGGGAGAGGEGAVLGGVGGPGGGVVPDTATNSVEPRISAATPAAIAAVLLLLAGALVNLVVASRSKA